MRDMDVFSRRRRLEFSLELFRESLTEATLRTGLYSSKGGASEDHVSREWPESQ
jgi:hypothetical protein